jgi:hypothetical protein
MPEATAYSLFNQDANASYQVWYRISGGDALFASVCGSTKNRPALAPKTSYPASELRQELTSNTPPDGLSYRLSRGWRPTILMAIIGLMPRVPGTVAGE